ncbi:MAG: hypothetical protein ACRCSN_15755 [Dermatophilaceae bacterium]
MTSHERLTPARGGSPGVVWPVLLLSLPAGVAIWSGWVGIGTLCGFGKVQPLPGIVDGLVIDTRITLPIGMETYAAVALRAWLTSPPGVVRRFAKWSALTALLVGASGQIAYHLMVAAGITAAPWPVVAAVSTLPVAVLGMGAALAHLQRAAPTPGASVVATPAAAPGLTSPTDAGGPGGRRGPGWADRTDRTDTTTSAQVSGGGLRQDRPDRTRVRPDRTAHATGHEGGGDLAEVVRGIALEHPGWTQKQVAAAAGCSVRTVRRHQATPPPAAPLPAPAADDAPRPAEDDAPPTASTHIGAGVGAAPDREGAA